MRNVLHFGQNVRTRRFQMYDHGSSENQRRYGQISPPDYPVQRITNKHIIWFTSDNDWLSMKPDRELLKKRLSVPLYEEIDVSKAYSRWNHIDYIWAMQAGKHVYAKVLDIMNKFQDMYPL